MKKHLVKFTLMLLAIALGVSNAFAEDVYKKNGEDKTGTYRWTNSDLTEWQNTKLEADGESLIFDGTGSTSKEFNFNSQEPLVTLVAKFKAGNDCGNEGSYDFFTFGGITFKFNKVNKNNSGYFKLVVDGTTEKTLEGIPTSVYYTITIVVNHAADEASYTLANTSGVIASGTEKTTADFKKVEFGHYTAEGATYNNKKVQLKSLEIKEDPDVVLTLNNTYKYSTFCSDWNVDFSGVTDVEAYKATVNGNEVTLTQVKDKVKAGEGLLIKNVGNVTSVTLPVAHDAVALEKNCLKGVTKNMEAKDFEGKTAYILVSDKEFKYIDPVKSDNTLRKGKAYLEIPDGSSAKPSTLFIGEATAINGVAVEKKADNAIYNLQGMRVKTPSKGLYIINGKKYRF